MILLLLWLAQAPAVPVYTNIPDHSAGVYRPDQIVITPRPAAPKPLPKAELAGLYANQYFAMPLDWQMGPSSTVINSRYTDIIVPTYYRRSDPVIRPFTPYYRDQIYSGPYRYPVVVPVAPSVPVRRR